MTLGEEKLKWWVYQMEKEFRWYVQPFWYNTRVWRTDRQTELAYIINVLHEQLTIIATSSTTTTTKKPCKAETHKASIWLSNHLFLHICSQRFVHTWLEQLNTLVQIRRWPTNDQFVSYSQLEPQYSVPLCPFYQTAFMDFGPCTNYSRPSGVCRYGRLFYSARVFYFFFFI